MISVLRSLPTTAAIADLVGRSYGLDVESCALVRSFVNEVYEVQTTSQRYVLKLYHHGGWSTEEIAWEGELVDHLVANRVPVAKVVPLLAGGQAGEVTAPEGRRPFLLSEYVEGRKPQQPFDDQLYRDYGRLLARLHDAGDTFATERYRRPFGLEHVLDDPLSRLREAMVDDGESLRLVEDLATLSRRHLAELSDQGMDWGVRHGDVTLDNVHRTDNGLVIHDFDLAHVGWRVADLGSCLSTPFAESFRAGYTELRPIGATDEAALPWLRVVEVIANLAFHLTDKTAWRGTESLGEGWVEGGLTDLRALADQLST